MPRTGRRQKRRLGRGVAVFWTEAPQVDLIGLGPLRFPEGEAEATESYSVTGLKT